MWNVTMVRALQAAVQAAAEGGAATGGEGAPSPGPGGLLGSPFAMMAAVVAVMYFFLIRPGQKREKERREMLARLAKGDHVVTTGGLCGRIVGLKEKTVVLSVTKDDAVKMEFIRGAVSQVTTQADDS